MRGEAAGVGDLPSGLITFVFTDIEGSTRLFERLGDEYLVALERHREIIREAAADHGGSEVKTEGDGLFIAFPDAGDALAACYAAQVALAAEHWPRDGAIRVRMGMHTGIAEPTKDRDYMTVAVHLAARVSAAAHGGQVLVSQATAQHLTGKLPSGAALSERGQFRLKGFSEPERLFQLTHPALRADFPPLRASPAEGHSLPSMRTSFVGRADELQELETLLTNNRLVTIVGPGGAGKTRLALEVGARLSVHSDGGTLLADVSPITDPAHVVGAITSALGVHNASDDPLQAATRVLAGRDVLLIVDNCEQVIDAVAEVVDELIFAAPGLRVLATSRETLRIPGEQVWRIPALPVPELDSTPEALAETTCGRLFLDRARLVSSQFRIDQTSAPAVASICRQCDGIPLAIELAAARVAVLPVTALASELAESLAAFGAGPRGSAERHRTMEGAIDWGYRLLPEDQQNLLQRLATFVGGFTLDAAKGVAPHLNVPGGLPSLVQKSLVVFDADAERYRLLEPIRQFAESRLTEAPEAAWKARQAHAAYFAAFALQAETPLTGPDQAIWLDRLGVEHDNLRRAIAWLVQSGAECDAARALVAIRRYWFIRADPTEWFDLAQPLLISEELPLPDRAWLLLGAAHLGIYRDPRESLRWAQRATEADASDPVLVAEATAWVAAASYFMGAPDADIGRRAVGLARELADPVLLGFSLVCLALSMNMEPASSREPLTEGLAVTATSGDLWIRSLLAGNLALGRDDDIAQSLALFEEALTLDERLGNPNPLTMANLSIAYSRLGNLESAREWLANALRSAGRNTYDSLGSIDAAVTYAVARGQWDAAGRLAGFTDYAAQHAGIGVYGEPEAAELVMLRQRLGDQSVAVEQAGALMSWTEALALARSLTRESD